MTADTFVEILQDMDKFLSSRNIKRPVILIIDGASPHISLAMAKFCGEVKIQPWLLKPNTTHLCQPLDLSFFSSLKTGFRRNLYLWHQDNIGKSISRYTVVPVLRDATESILTNKPSIIGNGFRKAGLFPWNPNAVDKKRMGPSSVFMPSKRLVACDYAN